MRLHRNLRTTRSNDVADPGVASLADSERLREKGIIVYLREQQHRFEALLFVTSWLRMHWLFRGARAMCVGSDAGNSASAQTEHLMLESPYGLQLPIFPC